MKRDIKINYGRITETIYELKKYEDSLDTMKRCLRSIKSNLQQSEAKSVTALLENFSTSEEDINKCQKENKDIKKILDNYIQAMSAYATPIAYENMTQIDRNDVWWNLNSIAEYEIDLREAIYYGSSYHGSFSRDEDVIDDEEYNAREIDEINALGNSLLNKMNTYMDDLWAIYNTKIVPFENTDDEFAHKARDLYWSYTGLGDWIGDFFSALGEGIQNLIIGVIDALVDLLKGLAQLVVGVLKYVGSGAVVLVSSPFGATPAWAKDYFDGANDLLGGILNDPMILVEGIAQGASDAIDTKGVCYSIGYVGGSILGVKGLDKVGKFAKGVLSGTKADIVVNSLDDIAKHGLKSIDEIVNTAKITSLLELKRIGISSVDDLVGLGVTTAKDLPKLGIHTMKDLAELGIKSADDLAKLGIKNVDDFVEAGLGSLNDAHRMFKGASGAEMPEITSKFNYKSKYNEVEFTKQLKNQEKGLNDLTISEFVENRKKYKEVGRSKEASKLQKELREKFRQDKIDELFASGTSYEDAVNEADKWMKKQAVLHDPDQIAGGNPLNLTGLGDKNINSSIGSQWRYRIDDFEKQIMDFANTIPKSEWGNVKLNIKLTY